MKNFKSKGKYPFINPLIVTKDGGIVDGQHRYQACEINHWQVEFIQLPFTSSELHSKKCIEKIKSIKKQQSEKLDEWFRENNVDFEVRLTSCSSDDRIRLFYSNMDQFKTDKEYWEKFGEIYVLSSNNFYNKEILIELFTSSKKDREYIMTEEERMKLSKMPNKIKIYRGMSIDEEASGNYGISWTLEKNVAKMFATTYLHNYDTHELRHIVKELTISKEKVVAYFTSREEKEIIYIASR